MLEYRTKISYLRNQNKGEKNQKKKEACIITTTGWSSKVPEGSRHLISAGSISRSIVYQAETGKSCFLGFPSLFYLMQSDCLI